MQNFANAVLYGEELIAPGEEGIFELTLSNAAYLSSWKGNAQIKLPFDSAQFDKKIDELSSKSKKSGYIKNDISFSDYKERWQVKW